MSLEDEIEYLSKLLVASQDTYYFPYDMKNRLSDVEHWTIWDRLYELRKLKTVGS